MPDGDAVVWCSDCRAHRWHNQFFSTCTTLLNLYGHRQGCPLAQQRSSGHVHITAGVMPSQRLLKPCLHKRYVAPPRRLALLGRSTWWPPQRWPKLPGPWLVTLHTCYCGRHAKSSSHLVVVVPMHNSAM
jgi:hypothetical protein